MKIAYLIHWNEGAESGVLKKVMHQLAEWQRQGHQPALFLFTCKPDGDWRALCAERDIPLTVQAYKGTPGRMADFGLLAKQVRRWRPDVLYHRFDLYYLSLPALLRAFPSVLEINTNDMAELRMEQGFRYYYHSITRGKVLAAAAGHVYVSRELAESGHFRSFAKPSVVIGNGIRLEEYPLGAALPAGSGAAPAGQEEAGQPGAAPPGPVKSQSRPPRLVFIGSAGQPWHGLDHIAELAVLKPDWRFDLIGVEAAELAALLARAGRPDAAGAVTAAGNAAAAGRTAAAGPASTAAPAAGAAAPAGPAAKGRQAAVSAARARAAGHPAQGGELPPNLFFHGKLTRSGYQTLLDQADAAIGTLALYRKDMKEASPLKVREYLANGLPVIIGYEETDFPEEVPFLLRLPAERNNICPHLQEITRFVEAWQGRRIAAGEAARLDTGRKEAERLRFMAEIAARKIRERG
ncbi:glycosyltransferase [Paenibacillus pinistramenti]|uniref:glycosyltransferase n=1 Tax=Paenibacillus pinistramenti TaxID=1768003 RepID=UPI001109AA5C|nr:glycosyltransferase [Paenibacillus pinistramenti]